ncbi:MAG: ankyrin repeat domain-containing protein [Alphaproteobacteria bacterium]
MFGDNPQKHRDHDLTEACKRGDLSEAKRLVAAGAHIEQKQNGPLFYAAYFGHAAVVKHLLDLGAPVDGLNEVKATPLMGAAEQGHFECAKLLFEAGADRELRHKGGANAIEFALVNGHYKIVGLLVAEKPEPRAANPEEVVFHRPLGDKVLEEVYDFKTLERISLVRAFDGGPVEAVTRQDFDDLHDRDALHRAFNEYAKKGGKRDEAEVFPEVLVKFRPPLDGKPGKQPPRGRL